MQEREAGTGAVQRIAGVGGYRNRVRDVRKEPPTPPKPEYLMVTACREAAPTRPTRNGSANPFHPRIATRTRPASVGVL